MKIKKVICAKGKTGFFFDDQKAIKSGLKTMVLSTKVSLLLRVSQQSDRQAKPFR